MSIVGSTGGHGPASAPAPWDTGWLLACLAFVLALVPALYVYLRFAPVPTMAVPPLVAALPLVGRRHPSARGRRVAAFLLLIILVWLGLMTVGRLFAPAALVMGAAALIPPSRR